ncbi:hypothetical protein NQ318_021401, partial [Aromia moschata]
MTETGNLPLDAATLRRRDLEGRNFKLITRNQIGHKIYDTIQNNEDRIHFSASDIHGGDFNWNIFASGVGCIQLKQFETKCYFKLVKMSYLTESLKIEILMMIGYGDRARTQCEVVRLFQETHPDLPPLNQGTISKIEAQYREMGHVRKVPSKRQAVVDDDTKLNLLLALEENPITPARQLARDSNLNHKTVLKILKYEKKRPHKMQAVQELLEDDPDRRAADVPKKISASHLRDEVTYTLVLIDIISVTGQVRTLITSKSAYPKSPKSITGGHIVGRKVQRFVDGNLNSEKYVDLVRNHIIPSCRLLLPGKNNGINQKLMVPIGGAAPHL